jgi:hypothetical protein
VLVAELADDTPARFYFDRDSGLLVRRVTMMPTPVGDIPCQIDYDDYRDAGHGVKVPFVLQMFPATPRMELAVTATFRVQKVEENVSVDDARFAKPAPPAR